MTADDRYESVRTALPDVLPPITRIEAERALAKLRKHFDPPAVTARRKRYEKTRGDKLRYHARRCWISPKPTTGTRRGWGRLIHDVSHNIFARVYPFRRPHDPLHAKYETDIAQFVVESGWLSGSLRPGEKPKLALNEKRARELTRIEAAITRWESKQRRARNALRKLATKKRRLAKLLKEE